MFTMLLLLITLAFYCNKKNYDLQGQNDDCIQYKNNVKKKLFNAFEWIKNNWIFRNDFHKIFEWLKWAFVYALVAKQLEIVSRSSPIGHPNVSKVIYIGTHKSSTAHVYYCKYLGHKISNTVPQATKFSALSKFRKQISTLEREEGSYIFSVSLEFHHNFLSIILKHGIAVNISYRVYSFHFFSMHSKCRLT